MGSRKTRAAIKDRKRCRHAPVLEHSIADVNFIALRIASSEYTFASNWKAMNMIESNVISAKSCGVDDRAWMSNLVESEYRGNFPALSDSGIRFEPETVPLTNSIWESKAFSHLHKTWSMDGFDTLSLPTAIGEVGDSPAFDRIVAPDVENMPLKFPGTDVRLPAEYAAVSDIVRRIVNVRASMDAASYHESYFYLTWTQIRIAPFRTQRRSGLHVDGMQGKERPTKTPPETTFIVSNSLPTVFVNQVYDVKNFDTARYNLFREFEAQTDHRNEFTTDPYVIYMIDAFAVHRPQMALRDTRRTFLKMVCSRNADNPMFDRKIAKIEPGLDLQNSLALLR
jgi:hypothetical protein